MQSNMCITKIITLLTISRPSTTKDRTN